MTEINRYRINGILGTVVFHLVLVVVFLSVKLGEAKKKHTETFPIEILESITEIDELIKEPEKSEAELPSLDEQTIRNIAVNTANRMDEEINTEKYIEQLKEEMGIEELNQQLDRSLEDFPVMEEKKQEPADQNTMYSGPTTVTYHLENRRHRYFPKPVYRCKGSGLVVVDIVVNQSGEVIGTSLSRTQSDTNDPCLSEQALEYAARTLFNADLNAPVRQKGHIEYRFLPQ